MSWLSRCAAIAGALCLMAQAAYATPIDYTNVSLAYGDTGDGSSITVENWSMTNPDTELDPIPMPHLATEPTRWLSRNWLNQFWSVTTDADGSGMRELTISKATASEAWVTDPIALTLDFTGDTPGNETQYVEGDLEVWFSTRDSDENLKVVHQTWTAGSGFWSMPTTSPLTVEIAPIVLATNFATDFESDEQVTEIRVQMTVIPEPACLAMLAGGLLVAGTRRRRIA